jgi:hypothetical protein
MIMECQENSTEYPNWRAKASWEFPTYKSVAETGLERFLKNKFWTVLEQLDRLKPQAWSSI